MYSLFFMSIFFFLLEFWFFFNFKYLLINLLSIEFMMLSLFFNMFINLLVFNFEMFFLMVFLTFMVCEGVLGLSLLVSIVRVLGNSNIQNLFLMKI